MTEEFDVELMERMAAMEFAIGDRVVWNDTAARVVGYTGNYRFRYAVRLEPSDAVVHAQASELSHVADEGRDG